MPSHTPITQAEIDLLGYLSAHTYWLADKPLPEGWSYKGPYDLLEKHGEFYDGAAIMPDEWSGIINPTPKYCYDNAYWLAHASKGKLRYVEGLATRFITCDHAWCITEDGTVVDPTWAELESDVKPSAYYGVVIPMPFVRAARRRPENASALWSWGRPEEHICKQPYSPDVKLPKKVKT